MFVQIIEGRTDDAAGLARQGERWRDEVASGAIGLLGVTSGVTADGRAITIARFESEQAARANADREQQGAWWSETEKYYDGDVTFTESTDVGELLGGGSNDARFVQVMKISGVDRATVERLDREFEPFASSRSDLLGLFRVWTGPDRCIEAVYFTSEADARRSEENPPPEMQALMAEFGELMASTEYLDLVEPSII